MDGKWTEMNWSVGLMMITALAGTAHAQPANVQTRGTVTLRSGETLTGTILLAEFGVVVGAGIGTLRPDFGSMCIAVAGQEMTIPGRDIAQIDARWEEREEGGQKTWTISGITITRRDGQCICGQPTWLLHETTARVLSDDDEIHRVSTVQPGAQGFSPQSLIQSVCVGDVAPATPEVPPAQQPEAPLAPDAAVPTAEAPAPPVPAVPDPVSPMAVATADDLYGTITLRGGQTLTGALKSAEFGAAEGAGVGAQFPEHGSIILKVGEEAVRVPASQISAISATWAEETVGAATKWHLRQLVVTCMDGTQVTGTPTWHLHYSVAMVVPPGGRPERVTAIPLSREFSPLNFIDTVTIQPTPQIGQ